MNTYFHLYSYFSSYLTFVLLSNLFILKFLSSSILEILTIFSKCFSRFITDLSTLFSEQSSVIRWSIHFISSLLPLGKSYPLAPVCNWWLSRFDAKLRLPSPISCVGSPISWALGLYLSWVVPSFCWDWPSSHFLRKGSREVNFLKLHLSKIVFTFTIDCSAEYKILGWKPIFLRILVALLHCHLPSKISTKMYYAILLPMTNDLVFQHFLFNHRVLKFYEDLLYKGLFSFTILGTQWAFSNGRLRF